MILQSMPRHTQPFSGR